MLSELFSQVLSRRIALSDDERLTACVILNDRLVSWYDPTDAQRAALVLATVEDSREGDLLAKHLVTVFRQDIEVLAGVSMALVRTMEIRWDGTMATLENAMLATSRTSVVLDVLMDRLVEDLRTGRDSEGWKLSGKGRLFLNQIHDVELLTSVAHRAQSNLPALARLASLGCTEHLLKVCELSPPHSASAWVTILESLPGKPLSVQDVCSRFLSSRPSSRVRNDVLEAQETVLMGHRLDLFDTQDSIETFINHAGR